MVLVDNGGGLVAEVHSVPTVHVTAADGAAIKAYAETPGQHGSDLGLLHRHGARPNHGQLLVARSQRG